MDDRKKNKVKMVPILIGSLLLSAACTGVSSIKYQQQDETGDAVDFNSKMDLLWVVDNSASMDSIQNTVRSGMREFTEKYMSPDWDIQVAVITTDTYLANVSFNNYLNSTAVAAGGASAHIQNLVKSGDWRKPEAWATDLVNPADGTFSQNVTFKHLVPVWGPDYAKLLPGNHDGPITSLCFESMTYFFHGVTTCATRDNYKKYDGSSRCLIPDKKSGESGLQQCVNSAINDTVRSGKAIIKTILPDDAKNRTQWIKELTDDFTINATTGSIGHGSERGLSSVAQFIDDNELGSGINKLFRKDSIRSIIFVTDEEDQSMEIPAAPAASYNPFTDYKCDLASWKALNSNDPTGVIANNYCCTGGACRYGAAGTTCQSKTVDGYTYTPTTCPDETKLIPVSTFKDKLDGFFTSLDGNETSAKKSYFITSIVPTTAASIQNLQNERNTQDADLINNKGLNLLYNHAVDRGDRYIELGNLVGNNSIIGDVGASSYSDTFNELGKTVVLKRGFIKTAFSINPDKFFNIVSILHADGTSTVVPDNAYEILDHAIQITDLDLLLSLKNTDKIKVSYQPNGRT